MHSLRSRGDTSFEEISLTIPCLEMGYDSGIHEFDCDQGFIPRCYKTHFWYRDCPKGAKYVVVVRGMHGCMRGWRVSSGGGVAGVWWCCRCMVLHEYTITT